MGLAIHMISLFLVTYLKKNQLPERRYTDNIFHNIIQLLKLFFVKPLPNVPIQLIWQGQILKSKTEQDGFFRFSWKSVNHIPAGWHLLIVECLNTNGKVIGSDDGKIFVPHITQFVFISDIDDTIMVSHSATVGSG